MVEAVKNSYPRHEIAEAAYVLQTEIEAGERTVIGVHRFVQEIEEPGELHRTDPALERNAGRRRVPIGGRGTERRRTRPSSRCGWPPPTRART